MDQKLKFPSIKHCHVHIHRGDGLVVSLPTSPLHLCVHTPSLFPPMSEEKQIASLFLQFPVTDSRHTT